MSEKRSSKGGEIPQMYNLDEMDRKIIAALHHNSRISYTDLGTQIGLSRVAVQARINALSEKGIIERFTVVINPGKVGLQVSAFSMSMSNRPSWMKSLRNWMKSQPSPAFII